MKEKGGQESEQEKSKHADSAGFSDGSEYYIGDEKQYLISSSSNIDEVNGVYQVVISQPLPHLDTGMARAYSVVDKQDSSSDKLYAVILDKRYPVRLAEINKLVGERQSNFCNVVAAQVIKSSLGKGRFFVVIVERPHGVSLSEYIKVNGSVSDSALYEKIILPVASVIKFLVQKNIVHGRINLDNIYINDSGELLLGECISEVCGFSQRMVYEDLNRSMSIPVGKGGGVLGCTDHYALGVVTAILLRGHDVTEDIPDEQLLTLKFSEGTFKILADGLEISNHIRDFLRGTMNDKKKEVWQSEQVWEWINGRAFNLLPPGDNKEAGRPIVFNDKKYFNKKHLAHDMYLNWSIAKDFIRQDTLLRWIERSVEDSDLASRMEVFYKRSSVDLGGNFDKNDELLAQYIILMDPLGPIRVLGMSAMLDGVGATLAHGLASNSKIYSDAFEVIVMYGLISYMSVDKKRGAVRNDIQEAAFDIQNSSDFLRKRDLGFGIERCLYELNPTLSCQSPLVLDDCPFGLIDLLSSLDANEKKSGIIIDRQIGAFLSARLDIKDKIRVNSLIKFPDFLSNSHIQILALLSLAQEKSDVGKLLGLCSRVATSLEDVIESFHNKFIRENIKEVLSRSVTSGSLPKILSVIADQKNLINDRLGFRRSVNMYRKNAIKIARLSNRKSINNMGYRYGLHLSVLFSFFVTIMVFMVLILKAF